MKNEYEAILNEFADSYDLAEKLKAILTDSVSKELREQIILEIHCFEFYYKSGDLFPNIEGPDSCYPDLNRFTEDNWKFIEFRLKAEENIYVKGRYAHLLYKKTRHNGYAGQAIELYKSLSENYLVKSLEDENALLHFFHCIECYHSLSVLTKYKTAECKDQLLKLLKDVRVASVWKGYLMETILLSPLFKRKDLLGLTRYMVESMHFGSALSSLQENYFQTCLRLAKKEQVDEKPIFLLLGEFHMQLAAHRSNDETGIIPMNSFQKAAFYFKIAQNAEKENEAIVKLIEQKSKIHLKTFRHEFKTEHVKALNDELNERVDFLLKQDEGFAYAFLVNNDNILKDEESLDQEAREYLEDSILGLANLQIHDLNGNIKVLSEDEKIAHQKNNIYSMYLQNFVVTFLEKLFYSGIRTGKLSAIKLMKFFNSTWFSKPLSAAKAKSDDETFSWMLILGPGLYNLLSQIEAACLDVRFKPNFQLSIDTLSVKLEGMIRDLARISGLVVTKAKDSETVELNLEEMLRVDAITGLFEPKDVCLWKFLFTRQGWNLRNNVAHAFFRPADYNSSKAFLILLAILRMCKYEHLLNLKRTT
jgi:hypothetical protein